MEKNSGCGSCSAFKDEDTQGNGWCSYFRTLEWGGHNADCPSHTERLEHDA